MGITDAELASGLANVLARQMDTMVHLINDRNDSEAVRTAQGESLIYYKKKIDLLDERVDLQKQLIRKLTEAGKMLQEKLEIEQSRSRMLLSDQDMIEDVLRDEMRKRIVAERELQELQAVNTHLEVSMGPLRVQYEQAELRMEGLETILRKWLDGTVTQMTIDEYVNLRNNASAALAASKEQGLERDELPTEGAAVGEGQSSTPHARSHSWNAAS